MESVPEQPRLDEEHRVARNPLHGRKGSEGAADASRAGFDHVEDFDEKTIVALLYMLWSGDTLGLINEISL